MLATFPNLTTRWTGLNNPPTPQTRENLDPELQWGIHSPAFTSSYFFQSVCVFEFGCVCLHTCGGQICFLFPFAVNTFSNSLPSGRVCLPLLVFFIFFTYFTSLLPPSPYWTRIFLVPCQWTRRSAPPYIHTYIHTCWGSILRPNVKAQLLPALPNPTFQSAISSCEASCFPSFSFPSRALLSHLYVYALSAYSNASLVHLNQRAGRAAKPPQDEQRKHSANQCINIYYWNNQK